MSKIWRNRIIVALVILAMVAGFAVMDRYGLVFPIARSAVDPHATFNPIAAGDRIEEKVPEVDVVHIGMVRSIMNWQPTFHVGVMLYPEKNPYAVELTDTGYNILAPGVYVWEEGKGEPPGVEWRRWTQAKYEYYSEHAMFRPGQAARVVEAMDGLKQWYEDILTTKLFMAVFEEAMPYQELWIGIEITYLGTGRQQMTFGIDASGKPGYVVAFESHIGAIEYLWKKSVLPEYIGDLKRDVGERDDWAVTGYYIAKAVRRGRFTVEDYHRLKEIGTIVLAPGFHPMYGQIPYGYGFNYPWQARTVPT